MGFMGRNHIPYVLLRGLAMWICDNCNAEFDEPEEEMESYESYYGVSSMFPDRHYFTMQVCPCCGSEDIEEREEEWED